jgi:hypothetical protein
LQQGNGECLGEVSLPEGLETKGYGVHPALLDAAFHALAGAGSGWSTGERYLPFEIGRYAVYQEEAESAWVHVRVQRREGEQGLSADVTLADESGAVLSEVVGLRLQRANGTELKRWGRKLFTG